MNDTQTLEHFKQALTALCALRQDTWLEVDSAIHSLMLEMETHCGSLQVEAEVVADAIAYTGEYRNVRDVERCIRALKELQECDEPPKNAQELADLIEEVEETFSAHFAYPDLTLCLDREIAANRALDAADTLCSLFFDRFGEAAPDFVADIKRLLSPEEDLKYELLQRAYAAQRQRHSPIDYTAQA